MQAKRNHLTSSSNQSCSSSSLHFTSYHYHPIEKTEGHALSPTASPPPLAPHPRAASSPTLGPLLVIDVPRSTVAVPPRTVPLPFQRYIIPVTRLAPCTRHTIAPCVAIAADRLRVLDPHCFAWQDVLCGAWLDDVAWIPGLTRVVLRVPSDLYEQVHPKQIRDMWMGALVTLGQDNVIYTSEYKQGCVVASTQFVLVPGDPPAPSLPPPLVLPEPLPSASPDTPADLWTACLHQRFDLNLPLPGTACGVKLDVHVDPDNEVDDNTAGVPPSELRVHPALRTHVGLLDGSLVRAQPSGSTAPMRWLRLVYAPTRHAACISAHDAANWDLGTPHTPLDVRPGFCTALPTLTSIEVALVYAPHADHVHVLRLALRQLASQLQTNTSTLLIHINDLLQVTPPPFVAECYEACLHNHVSPEDLPLTLTRDGARTLPPLYFRVVAVCPAEAAAGGQTCAGTQLVHNGWSPCARPRSLRTLPAWMLAHPLCAWLAAATHPHATTVAAPPHALLTGARGIGKRVLVETLALHLGITLCMLDARAHATHDDETRAWARATAAHPVHTRTGARALLLVLHAGRLRTLPHVLPTCPIPVVATAHAIDDVAAPVAALFSHRLVLAHPDTPDVRETWVREVAPQHGLFLVEGVCRWLAKNAPSLTPRDMHAFFAYLAQHLLHPSDPDTDADPRNFVVDAAPGLETVQRLLAEFTKHHLPTDVQAPAIPTVRWEDIGGLDDVRRVLLSTFQWPLQYPDLFASSVRPRSGVLLYGPPGTGKTLLAKAVATECALHFMSVKGPELLNMYVGASEAHVRGVFAQAARMAPALVFFDELDALAPRRSGGTDDAADRVVAQLLAALDARAPRVFVMAATNRPDLLDPALLRPGRLDARVLVGLPRTPADVRRVLAAQTRHLAVAPALLERAAELCATRRVTGADLAALVADAARRAMLRCIAAPHTTPFAIAAEDFDDAAAELVPSVTEAEWAHYRRLEESFAKQG